MIRKEPPISRRHPMKETPQKTGQEASLETSEHELQNGKAIITGKPREKSREESSSGYSPSEAPPVSLWLPFTAYFTSFILIFLKNIEYNVSGFSEVVLSPTAPIAVLFGEYILRPLLQPILLFIFVWLILLFLRLFRVGKRKNFRRWAHSGFAAFLVVATLISPPT
jgi:hypothetical protein